MITLYRSLWKLCYFILMHHVKQRIKLGKEDKDRIDERYGISSVSRPSGDVIWVHAASVGESLSAITLIDRLKKEFENCTFLLTTGTVSSAGIIAKKGLKNVIHQYVPIDYEPFVDSFFAFWKPKYAFILESELWPNLITKCTAKKTFLVNARMSDRSFKKWKLFKPFLSVILDKFDVIMTQTKEDQSRYAQLTASDVIYTGNLKYSSQKLKVDDELLNSVKKISRRYVFTAASTHEGEEGQILYAYQLITERLGKENVTLILIPRHPERAFLVSELIKSRGFSVCFRTNLQEECDVICVDSFGEVGTFYALSDFVFVGGSLVRIGGHNIFEAIQLKKPVMFGQYMFNFREMSQFAINENVGFIVNTPQETSETFCKYVKDRNDINKKLESIEQYDPANNIIEVIRENL